MIEVLPITVRALFEGGLHQLLLLLAAAAAAAACCCCLLLLLAAAAALLFEKMGRPSKMFGSDCALNFGGISRAMERCAVPGRMPYPVFMAWRPKTERSETNAAAGT